MSLFPLNPHKALDLRYGENPHQSAALYGKFFDYYEQLHGKELSYNNILDLTAAVGCVREFQNEDPTIVIVKHTNPCGVGQGPSLVEAWGKAFATDRHASFGGIVASNTLMDADVARAIAEIFTEIVVAPGFDEEALAILTIKKNLRLIKVKKDPFKEKKLSVRSVGAESFLIQEPDIDADTEGAWKVVTKRAPTARELASMKFGWRVATHVKSNAIVFAGPDRTLGVGAGQMSRINSVEIATLKAKEAQLSLAGSAVASDAFFPFPDAMLAAAGAGATAVIQPGGSLKDDEVITAADDTNIAMIMTGTRHFKH